MAWRLFGKAKIAEVAISSLACPPGSVGIQTQYAHYFFGIKTRTSWDVKYVGGIMNPATDPLMTFSSDSDRFEKLENGHFLVEKRPKQAVGYRWTCRRTGMSGVYPTPGEARLAAYRNCCDEYDVDRVTIASLTLQYAVDPVTAD